MKTLTLSDRVYSCGQFKFLFFLLLLVSATAQATTWYVKPGGTGTGSGSWANAAAATSLATIIAGAASGDQVWVVGSTGGTIYFPTTTTTRTIAFTLKSGVSVYGGFAGTETALTQRNYTTNVTILSGAIGGTGNSYNVVVSSGNTAGTVLDGFTIENGNASGTGQYAVGGGIYNSATTVAYSNCTITANTAIGAGSGTGGGGVYVTGSGAVTFSNCTFSSNSTTVVASSSTGGGGLCVYNGTATLTGCTFSDNTSSSEGGGILNTNSGTLTLTTCKLTGNVATGSGGGLATYSSASYLTGCTISSNISNSLTTGGGGIYTTSGTGTQLTNCVFVSNSAHEYGGGFYDNGGDALGISVCVFSSNSANDGGGVCTNNGTSPSIANCRFSSNVAEVSGGGIYNNNAGNGSLVTDTFFNNTASDSAYKTSPIAGGGVCNVNGSNIALVHCFFQGNVAAEGDGGGAYNMNTTTSNDSSDIFEANVSNNGNGGGLVDSSGNPKFYKSVFSDNQAAQYGGGIYTANNNGSLESITLYNNTANSAGWYGDGIYVSSGNIKIYGNMIWSRTSGSIGLVTSAAAVSSAKVDYNDIIGVVYTANGGVGNISSTPSFTNSGNYTGADGLWETADDGLHLVDGSPGTNAVPSGYYFDVTDIAEAPRPYPGNTEADMGAYEGPGSYVVLALQWLSFKAVPASQGVADLNWEVDGGDQGGGSGGSAAAGQPVLFRVWRAVDGGGFTVIGTVQALPGQADYQYVDMNAVGEMLSYRLEAVQADGTGTYSSMVVITNVPGTMRATLRPSMVQQGGTILDIVSPQAADANVWLTDATGKVLLRRATTLSEGDNNVALDVAAFPAGIYFVRVSAPGVKQVLTLVKL